MKTPAGSKRKRSETSVEDVLPSVEGGSGSSSPPHPLTRAASPHAKPDPKSTKHQRRSGTSVKIVSHKQRKTAKAAKKPKITLHLSEADRANLSSSSTTSKGSLGDDAFVYPPSSPNKRRLLAFICKHDLGKEISLSDPDFYQPPDSHTDEIRDVLSVSRSFCALCENRSLNHAVKRVQNRFEWTAHATKLTEAWRARGRPRTVGREFFYMNPENWRSKVKEELKAFVDAFSWQQLYDVMGHDLCLWHAG